MTVMRRWECPEHGETQLQFRGPLTTERVRVCPCGKEAVQVEYVLVEQLREGASRLERAGKAVAVELGFCDPDEWGTDECNREDRDTALRAARAALDAANHTGP